MLIILCSQGRKGLSKHNSSDRIYSLIWRKRVSTIYQKNLTLLMTK